MIHGVRVCATAGELGQFAHLLGLGVDSDGRGISDAAGADRSPQERYFLMVKEADVLPIVTPRPTHCRTMLLEPFFTW